MKVRGAALVAVMLVTMAGLLNCCEAFPWKGMFSNRDGEEARVVKREQADAKSAERPLLKSQEGVPVHEEHDEVMSKGSRGVNRMEQAVGDRDGGSMGVKRDGPRRKRRQGNGSGRDVRYATVGSAVYAVEDEDIAVLKGVARRDRGGSGVTREGEHETDQVVERMSDRVSDRVSERGSERVVSEKSSPVEVEVRDSEKVERANGVDATKKEDSSLAILKKEISELDTPLGPQPERKLVPLVGSEHELAHVEEKTNGWWSMEGKERIREGVLQAMQGLNRLYGALGGGDTAARLVANGSSVDGRGLGESVGDGGAEGIGLESNGSSRAAAVERGGNGAVRPVGFVSVVGGVVIVVGVAMLGVSFAQRQGTRSNSNGGGSGGAALYPPRGPSFV